MDNSYAKSSGQRLSGLHCECSVGSSFDVSLGWMELLIAICQLPFQVFFCPA